MHIHLDVLRLEYPKDGIYLKVQIAKFSVWMSLSLKIYGGWEANLSQLMWGYRLHTIVIKYNVIILFLCVCPLYGLPDAVLSLWFVPRSLTRHPLFCSHVTGTLALKCSQHNEVASGIESVRNVLAEGNKQKIASSRFKLQICVYRHAFPDVRMTWVNCLIHTGELTIVYIFSVSLCTYSSSASSCHVSIPVNAMVIRRHYV